MSKSEVHWFWNERVWWPPGYGWDSLESTPEEPYPVYSHLYLPIISALLLIPVRAAFEWFIARPVGKWLGIKQTHSALPGILKQIFGTLQRPFRTEAELSARLASASTNGHLANGTSAHKERKEEESLTRRLRFAIPKSRLDKFAECSWRMTCYIILWIYGFSCIWNKSWVWNTTEMWLGYPRIPLDPGIWLLYQAEAAFYWNLMISQFFDNQIQRKDFIMNFVHHVATLALIWFSWTINYVRGGAMVMVIHDICDPLIELAKMSRYIGRPDLCNVFFGVFTLLWFFTRLGVYPYKLLYGTLIEAPAFIAFYPVYYIINFFLLALFALHLLWTHLIIGIIRKALQDGEAEDTRSESGSDFEDEHED